MTNTISNSKQAEMEKRGWPREKVIPVLTMLLVIALTVALFLYRDKVAELGNYGYLGIFAISLAFNATIFLPMPIFVILFVLGAAFNPVLVGVVAATGGAIGELTGYMAGYSGRGIVRNNQMYARAEGWMRRWGLLTIFIFTLVPFTSFDLAGMTSGALRFPVWKFLLVCLVGKGLLYSGVALAGARGWGALVSGLHFIAPISIGVLAAVATLALLTLALVTENRAWKREQ